MTSAVGWDWGAVFDTADLEVGTNESADSSVTTLTIDTTASATVGSDLDVKGSDSTGLDNLDKLLGSEHGGVRGRLVLVTLNHLTTGDATDGFSAGNVGDVDEGIVLRGEDVDRGEDLLVLLLGWEVDDVVSDFLNTGYLSCHQKK